MQGFKVSYKTQLLRGRAKDLRVVKGDPPESTQPVMQMFHFQYDKHLKHKYMCPACQQYLWEEDERQSSQYRQKTTETEQLRPKDIAVTLPKPPTSGTSMLCDTRRHCCCTYQNGRRLCCLKPSNHRACRSRP